MEKLEKSNITTISKPLDISSDEISQNFKSEKNIILDCIIPSHNIDLEEYKKLVTEEVHILSALFCSQNDDVVKLFVKSKAINIGKQTFYKIRKVLNFLLTRLLL